jgi:mono/diheme cytochrome c family protein
MSRPERRRAATVAAIAAAAAASLVALAGPLPALGSEDAKPYRIVDGKVDQGTYVGFRRYNAVCLHCHGPDGAGGSFAPSLVDAPLAIGEFRTAVLAGRANGASVMKGFADDPNVASYVDEIYAYLRARADGALGRGRPLQAEER